MYFGNQEKSYIPVFWILLDKKILQKTFEVKKVLKFTTVPKHES